MTPIHRLLTSEQPNQLIHVAEDIYNSRKSALHIQACRNSNLWGQHVYHLPLARSAAAAPSDSLTHPATPASGVLRKLSSPAALLGWTAAWPGCGSRPDTGRARRELRRAVLGLTARAGPVGMAYVVAAVTRGCPGGAGPLGGGGAT